MRRSIFPLLATGLVTLLGQVVLLREVLVASYGSELIYVLAMGLLMLGTAVGAVVVRRPAAATERRVSILFTLFATMLPLLIVALRALRLIFRVTPGAYMPFFQQILGISLVLVPFGVAGGMLFAASARLYIGQSRTLAAAYAVESVGGVIGGAASTLLIAVGVQNLAAGVVCAIIAACAALSNARSWRRSIGAALLCALAIALAVSGRIDRTLTAMNHPQLLATRDTPYGRATVTGSLGQIVVFENDALAFESQGTSAEEFVHLAALQVEKPGAVLIIGGAVEGLSGEVSKHRPARVVRLEVDRKLVELARPFLTEDRTPITFTEPRRFLARPGSFDLILSGMPEPDSGQASRFYTAEFFTECARRMSPGGVMAFRLHSSENLWSPALARRTASIVRAARSAFADVIVLPGGVNVILASNRRLQRDPEVLGRRLVERGVGTRLVSPRYIRYVHTNDRLAEIENLLARTAAPMSTDVRPVCYQYTLVLWLSRFFPALALTDPRQLTPAAHPAPWIVVAVLIAAGVLAGRRSIGFRRTLMVGFAGFAGVVLEGVLILAYQIGRGVLYRDLGILLMMFMTGLAAGSWFIGSRSSRIHAVAGSKNGISLLLGTIAISGVTAWSVSSGPHGLAMCALLLLSSGFATGGLFAFGSSRRGDDQAAAAGPLYAADLAGGVVGSIAASLFLVPVLGLTGSALVIAVVALVMLSLA